MLVMTKPKKPAPSDWPERLKRLRKELDLSQPEAAAKAGVPLATWRNWEHGRTSINSVAASLLKLAFNLED